MSEELKTKAPDSSSESWIREAPRHLPVASQHRKEEAGDDYRPRTPLGQRLWKHRQRIIASGEPLLNRDQIEKEVERRRGGTDFFTP